MFDDDATNKIVIVRRVFSELSPDIIVCRLAQLSDCREWIDRAEIRTLMLLTRSAESKYVWAGSSDRVSRVDDLAARCRAAGANAS
jgi:hypothetical protein